MSLLAAPAQGCEEVEHSIPLPCCSNCSATVLGEPPNPCPHQLPWQCKAPSGSLPGARRCLLSVALETCPQPEPPAPAPLPPCKLLFTENMCFPLWSLFFLVQSSQLVIVFWLLSRQVLSLYIKIFFSLFVHLPNV